MCSICWFPANPSTDFAVSGPGMMGINDDQICCGYGVSGFDVRGYDCALVPMASSNLGGGGMVGASRFCGASKGLASIGSQTAATAAAITTGIALDRTICCEINYADCLDS